MPLLGRIEFRVEVADAVLRSCDVLVLKFAQMAYGLDRAVLNRLGQNHPEVLPEPGEHVVIQRPAELAADALVFIGTPELFDLDYRGIRLFGTQAIEVVAEELPHAAEVCLTLHGAGYGLDEREAFRAEVAGVLDGLAGLRSGSAVRTITFLEWERRRAAQMTEILVALEAEETTISADHGGGPLSAQSATERVRTAGLETILHPHAFVAMPYGEDFEDVFHYGIVRPVERVGLLCERMDRSIFAGDIVEMMKQRIRDAAVMIADISGGNPNVHLEVGYAWASGVSTVLLCNQDTEPCFDVRGHRHLRYRTIREAERHLDRELPALIPTR